jgi:hypothetical protein
MRMVTHLDVDREMIDRALEAMSRVVFPGSARAPREATA